MSKPSYMYVVQFCTVVSFIADPLMLELTWARIILACLSLIRRSFAIGATVGRKWIVTAAEATRPAATTAHAAHTPVRPLAPPTRH